MARSAMLARAGLDIVSFAEQLSEQLRSLVPHSAACVVTVDPATGLLTGTYKFGGLADSHDEDGHWAQLEYGSDDPTRMAVIAGLDSPAMAVSHLPGGVEDSIRMRRLVGPAGYGDELRMVARHGDASWGGVNLFRAVDERPFDHDEVALLAAVSEVVATGLRAGLMARSATEPSIDVLGGPAVLVVGPDASLRQVSVGARELLDDLTAEDNRSPAASLIQSLAAAARRYATGASPTLPRARLRTPSGRWLIAEAAPLSAEQGPGGEAVITIDEARPPDVMSLLASAFGLTARERQVTQLVLSGVNTRGIADRLAMSSYTVQDHLKSVFDKAGVRSRRELMARVFFDQYAPRLVNGVSPSGWFRAAPVASSDASLTRAQLEQPPRR